MILLTWNSFTVITSTSFGKAMNYWQEILLTFTNMQNTRHLIRSLHKGEWLLFNLTTQIFHHFLSKDLLLILLPLYNFWNFLVSLIFQLSKFFCRICFKFQQLSLSIRNYFYWKLLFSPKSSIATTSKKKKKKKKIQFST